MSGISTNRSTAGLPVKWALVFVVGLIVYALAQPFANSRFGWNLPSLAALLGEAEQKPNPKKSPANSTAESNRTTIEEKLDSGSPARKESGEPEISEPKPDRKEPTSKVTDRESNDRQASDRQASDRQASDRQASDRQASDRQASDRQASDRQASDRRKPGGASEAIDVAGRSDRESQSELRYGILQDVGGDRYLSPSGLQYGPGSEEGHRLKHLERHLEDMPNRPGKHGVFEGDMAQVLKWIDDAYARGKQGAKGVRTSQEDGRTVYEVPFSKPIGYIGGRDGGRLRNPPAKQMRLVVQGKNFITAFPF